MIRSLPWAKIVALVAGTALVVPILAIVPVAFGERSFVRLPPESWSLRWWYAFLADNSWRNALVTSIQVATLSSIVSVAAGTAAALGMQRLPPSGKRIATALFLGPAVAPVIVLAVGLYAMARATGLVGTVTGLVIAHTMLALPYAVLNIGVSIAALDRRLEMAAAGLGAGGWRIFRTITLPLILPGVFGGAVFAFVTSFDEVVLAVFLSGPRVKTLPVRIWEEIRVEYTPIVAVAATIMIALAIAGAGISRLAARRTS